MIGIYIFNLSISANSINDKSIISKDNLSKAFQDSCEARWGLSSVPKNIIKEKCKCLVEKYMNAFPEKNINNNDPVRQKSVSDSIAKWTVDCFNQNN